MDFVFNLHLNWHNMREWPVPRMFTLTVGSFMLVTKLMFCVNDCVDIYA